MCIHREAEKKVDWFLFFFLGAAAHALSPSIHLFSFLAWIRKEQGRETFC